MVTLTAFDAAEVLPAASRAVTVKLYAVEGVSPVTVYGVPGAVATTVPARSTW